MSSQSEVTHARKKKMSKKNAMVDMNARLTKIAIATEEELDKAFEWGQCMEKLECKQKELFVKRCKVPLPL